ncbi:unnamed protein product [Somion occarium]|uniref:MYND-type domain-containing protein n=1 Tax=Somion occarium TaxID=3059160 RepID=A0ABP1DV92_9APHY
MATNSYPFNEPPSLTSRDQHDLINLLLNNPGEFGDKLMALHASGDGRRVDLTHLILDIVSSHTAEAQWNTFIDSSLIKVLLLIAASPSTYDCVDAREKLYATGVLQTLAFFTMKLSQYVSGGCFLEHAEHALKRFAPVFSALWGRRYTLLDSKSWAGLPETVGSLVAQVTLLHTLIHPLTPFINGSLQLVIQCWCLRRGVDKDTMSAISRIVVDTMKMGRFPLLAEQLRETFLDNGVSRLYFQTMQIRLRHEDMIDRILTETLLVIKICISMCTQLDLATVALESHVGRCTFSDLVILACQRQRCLGDSVWTPEIVQRGLDIIFMLTQNACGTPNAIRLARNLDLLPLVFSSALLRVPDTASTHHFWTTRLPAIVEFQLEEYTQGTGGRTAAFRHNLQQVVGKVWRPTIEALEGHRFDRADPRYTLLHSFLRLGRVLQLDRRAEPIPHFPGYETCVQSCHFPNCLCSNKRPMHPMRVCKGCWRVFYCGKPCQTADWKAGHREACRAR